MPVLKTLESDLVLRKTPDERSEKARDLTPIVDATATDDRYAEARRPSLRCTVLLQ
jgi:hypothetical protein